MLTKDSLVQTARLTWANPRAAARVVMGWPLTRGELWLVLALMAVAATLMAEGFLALSGTEADPFTAAIMGRPILFCLLQFAGLVLMTTLAFAVGRMAGGRGTFEQAQALVGWLQVLLLVLQAAQIVAVLLLPPLALVIGLASLGLTLWWMTCFTAELHGFTSLWSTLFAILAVMLGVVVALSLVLILGFGVGV